MANRLGLKFPDRYLIAVIILSAAYFAFWAFYQIKEYVYFISTYYDLGIYANSLYWQLHYAQTAFSLQYLVFFNHISPFSLLLLLAFSIHQNPIWLIIIQEAFLTITAVAVYLVAKDLTNSRPMAIALSIAFLVNPGIRGLTLFAVHIEAFVPFFALISFYSFMKARKWMFMASYLLLLSNSETSFAVGGFLLLGMLFFEWRYGHVYGKGNESVHKGRKNILIIGFILTALAIVFYHFALIAIMNSYLSATSNSSPPLILRVLDYVAQQVSGVTSAAPVSAYSQYSAMLGIIIVFLGFGLASMADPILTFIMCIPWFVEVFIVHNLNFPILLYQYYAYAVVPGSMIAAIMGYLIISNNKTILSGLVRLKDKKFLNLLPSSTISLTIFISITMLLSSGVLAFFYSIPPLYQSQINYSAIDSALTLIPSNSTVLAQDAIATHLYYVRTLELPPTIGAPPIGHPIELATFWTAPDYIVADKNIQGYDYLINSSTNNMSFNLFNYTKYNYSLYYNKSGLYIFKKDG